MLGRRPTPWGEMAIAAVAGGLIVAGCFAVFSRGGAHHAPPPAAPPATAQAEQAAARLRNLVASAHLSPAEEHAVLTALGEARESSKAAAAYFGAYVEDDGHAGALAAEHAEEMEAIIRAVIEARLASDVDQRRLHAVERQLTPAAADWLALDASGR